MKVNLNCQRLCVEPSCMRGVHVYMRELIHNYSYDSGIDYSLAFFDYKKERGNSYLLQKNLEAEKKIPRTIECNTLSYQDILKAYERNDYSYTACSYEDYLGESFDIVHIPDPFWLPHNINSKTIVTIHDVIPLYESTQADFGAHAIRMRSELEFIRDAETITCIADSESTKKDLIELLDYPEKKINVIPLGFETSKQYSEMDEKKILSKNKLEAKRYILYVGGVENRKGVSVLLKSYKKILSQCKGLKLIIAGRISSAYRDELLKLLVDMPIGSVELLGFVDNQTRDVLLKNARFFVLPSFAEGFGIPVLEAMQYGTPVIASNVTSLPEVGGSAAEYFEVGNVEQLAEKMEWLLKDDEKCRRMGVEGVNRCKHFSWEKMTKETEALYERVYNQ